MLSSMAVHAIYQYCTLWDIHMHTPSSVQWNLQMTDTLGLFCCYTQAVPFKLYHHGSVGTTELIFYREVKCMPCPLSNIFTILIINYAHYSMVIMYVCSCTVVLINMIIYWSMWSSGMTLHDHSLHLAMESH